MEGKEQEQMTKLAFTVRVGDRTYNIYADGRTEGFEDGDKPVMVVNRIPALVAEMTNALDRYERVTKALAASTVRAVPIFRSSASKQEASQMSAIERDELLGENPQFIVVDEHHNGSVPHSK